MRSICHRLKTYAPRAALLLRTAGKRDSGTELFEFALVAPLLLTFMFGIIWMGRAFNIYQTITRAAREGSRYAVLPNCASCGNAYPDTYSSTSCLTNPTSVFTNYVSPALAASNLDPTMVKSYCQKAQWLNPTSDPGVDGSMPQQCGVVISFAYPVQLAIPFTSLNGSTVNVRTQVQMRMENVSINSSGTPTCP